MLSSNTSGIKPLSSDRPARPQTSQNLTSNNTVNRNINDAQRVVAWVNSIQSDKVRQQQVYQN